MAVDVCRGFERDLPERLVVGGFGGGVLDDAAGTASWRGIVTCSPTVGPTTTPMTTAADATASVGSAHHSRTG